ncbi:hypothetical protein CAPTEDRAFT_203020 [Capitella teleta]|uniref:P2X purinoreceptor 7 intracellular domain-containing protein n=1 Tax=Capitella teleta TaxID=283909 RepID=R7TVU4_CAPTE|nr:hypothetical protein CAPTEDRAFT_203020 [Capitella teleta]|eukprot:ELT95130.1 hypothetical protein CAPTEDRAFT_203020 [Capitella teleta]
MACGREERSHCSDSETESDQYGECIDESFEYTGSEEEHDRTGDADTEYGGAPYLFEPLTETEAEREVRGENSQSDCESQSDSDEEDVDRDLCRVGNIEWCKCGQCKPMDSASESCCCQEHEHVVSKLNEMQPDPPACIAHTPMFADLCLKLHVLEVAHMYYRTQYGNLPQTRINERYRYVAYRQFVM